MDKLLPPLEWYPDAIQLKGFSRGVAEIQWLLVTLVLLYLILAGDPAGTQWPAVVGTVVYFVFSLSAGLLALMRVSRRWLLALNTWVMIAFITWLLYVTQGIDGPLVNLYLLAVITCALALGKLATLLEVCVIAACYLLLLYLLRGIDAFSGPDLAVPAAHVVMILLVGYLTTMLADAIHFANERMRVLATRDQLTGLYNRGTFHTLARALSAAASRSGRPLAVLVADMDNLKQINDRHGHAAGDEAIEQIGRALVQTLRDSDVVARYGGDEFGALLPDTDVDGAVKLARRVLEQLSAGASTATPTGAGASRLSIGIAGYPAHGRTVDELLGQADQAMYRSKSGGGHTVTVFSESATASVPASA